MNFGCSWANRCAHLHAGIHEIKSSTHYIPLDFYIQLALSRLSVHTSTSPYMPPPTKVFPETTKKYYQDHLHQVSAESPLKQITQYECDLSHERHVTCVPIDRFFRMWVQAFRQVLCARVRLLTALIVLGEAELWSSVPMSLKPCSILDTLCFLDVI